MLKKVLFSFSWNVVGGAAGFLIQIILARILGAEVYGEINYYLGYSFILYLIFSPGLPLTLPKFCVVYPNKESDIFWTFNFYILSGLLISIPFLQHFFLKKNIFLVISYAYCFFLFEFATNYLVGVKKPILASFYKNLFPKFLFVFFLFSFYFIHVSWLTNYFLSYEIAFLFVFIIVIGYKLKFPVFKFSYLQKSLFFYLTFMLYLACPHLGKIFQGNYSESKKYVGILSVGIMISDVISRLGISFLNVAKPVFAQHWKEKNIQALQNDFWTIIRHTVFIILPLFVFGVFFNDILFKILGKSYSGGNFIITILLLGRFIDVIFGVNGILLAMTKYVWIDMLNGFFKLFFTLLALFFLSSKYSWGVALSLTFGTIIVNILKFVEVFFIFKIVPFSRKHLWYFFTWGILTYLIFKGISLLNLHYIVTIFLISIFSLLIVFATFYFSPMKEDKKIVKKALYFFKNKVL